MFTAALLTIAKPGKKPKYPLTDKMHKEGVMSIYLSICVCARLCVCVEYQSAIKKE